MIKEFIIKFLNKYFDSDNNTNKESNYELKQIINVLEEIKDEDFNNIRFNFMSSRYLNISNSTSHYLNVYNDYKKEVINISQCKYILRKYIFVEEKILLFYVHYYPEFIIEITKIKGKILKYSEDYKKYIPDIVKFNGKVIKYSDSIYDDDIYYEAINNNYKAFKYIKNVMKFEKYSLLHLLSLNPNIIKYIDDQTHEMVKIAVNHNKLLLKYVKNKTPDLYIINYINENKIIGNDMYFSEISMKTENIYNILLLFYENPTNDENIIKNIIENVSYNVIYFIDNPSEELLLFLINRLQKEQNPYSIYNIIFNPIRLDFSKYDRTPLKTLLTYISNRYLSVDIQIIKFKPEYIVLINNKTESLCMIAIEKDPLTIKYIDNPSEELCLLALRLNPYAIRYIKNISYCQILQIAEKNIIAVFPLMKYHSEEMCLLAVNNDGYLLEFIKDQSYDVCIAAINQNWKALQYVENQHEEICLLALELSENHAFRFIKDKKFYYNIILEQTPYLIFEDEDIDLISIPNIIDNMDITNFFYMDPKISDKENIYKIFFDKFYKHCLFFPSNPSSELLSYIIKKDPKLFKFIDKDKQTIEHCLMAIESDILLMMYFSDENTDYFIENGFVN